MTSLIISSRFPRELMIIGSRPSRRTMATSSPCACRMFTRPPFGMALRDGRGSASDGKR